MKVHYYQITDEPQLILCEEEGAIETARKNNRKIWIDIQDAEEHELARMLDELEVTGLARRLCLEGRERAGFYPLKDVTFLVIPIQADAENFRDVEYLTFLSRKDFLLTIRDARSGRVQNAFTVEESASWLPDGSIAGLASALLIALSVMSLQRTVELREQIMELEIRMDREPLSIEIHEISHKRSELLTLESVVSGQLPVLRTLLDVERSTLKLPGIRDNLLCATANLTTTDRTLEWLEGRIDVMRSRLDGHAQETTNRRLGRLTVLSMIFMPITLMAGIWGMNFHVMPGMEQPYGYPVALALMLGLGLYMFFRFRRKGWLD